MIDLTELLFQLCSTMSSCTMHKLLVYCITDGHHDTTPAANGSRTTEIGNFTTVNCCQRSRVMSLHLLWTCPLCTINWAQSRLEMTFSSSQPPHDSPSLNPANATQDWSGPYKWYQQYLLSLHPFFRASRPSKDLLHKTHQDENVRAEHNVFA